MLTVPAETAFQKGQGPMGADLYNECNQVTPKNSAEVKTDHVPVVEVDRDGGLIAKFSDDSKWPRAYEYTDEDIGVTNLPAYTRFPELFEGAPLDLDGEPRVRQPHHRAQDGALTT